MPVSYSVRTKVSQKRDVYIENECLPHNSVILLEHIRTVGKSRLEEYMGKLTSKELSLLDKALAVSIDLKIKEDKTDGQEKSSK